MARKRFNAESSSVLFFQYSCFLFPNEEKTKLLGQGFRWKVRLNCWISILKLHTKQVKDWKLHTKQVKYWKLIIKQVNNWNKIQNRLTTDVKFKTAQQLKWNTKQVNKWCKIQNRSTTEVKYKTGQQLKLNRKQITNKLDKDCSWIQKIALTYFGLTLLKTCPMVRCLIVLFCPIASNSWTNSLSVRPEIYTTYS